MENVYRSCDLVSLCLCCRTIMNRVTVTCRNTNADRYFSPLIKTIYFYNNQGDIIFGFPSFGKLT